MTTGEIHPDMVWRDALGWHRKTAETFDNTGMEERRKAVGLDAEPERPTLAKRPVAWRMKDYADGWIVFQDEEMANRMAEETGAVLQGLYVRDGT